MKHRAVCRSPNSTSSAIYADDEALGVFVDALGWMISECPNKDRNERAEELLRELERIQAKINDQVGNGVEDDPEDHEPFPGPINRR